MTTTMPVNRERLRQRLFEQGLSEREFSRRTGLGQAVIRGMLHRAELNGSTAIADINRCLEQTGLTAGDLLDPPAPTDPDDTPTDDVQVLAQMLTKDTRLILHERLALALGWDLERLRAAIDDLDPRLRPIGLRVHQNGMGVTIRPADNRADQAQARLDQFRDSDDGLHQGTARVLHAVYAGRLSGQETKNDHMVHLGALSNRGAIDVVPGQNGRFRLTPDTAYAFDVHDHDTGSASLPHQA